MAGLEAGPSGIRNPRKLIRRQVLETLDSDSDDDFDIPHSSDDSGTSSDSDNEQPAVGSRSSSASDEAETVVDQFGWRIVNEDQDRLDPAFTSRKASRNIGNDCTQPIQFLFLFYKSHKL